MDNEKPRLTEEIAIKAMRDFFRNKPFIFFGTGISCALDERFGMSALKNALIDEMEKVDLTYPMQTEWNAVTSALNNGADLENALNLVSDYNLLKKITKFTGDFISKIDKFYAYRIAKRECQWPASILFRKLVDTLSEGDPILHALTPNYDMLFEYACDAAGIPYTNGLFGGVERRMDCKAAERAFLEPVQIVKNQRKKTVYKTQKHVRFYKVHGSLNLFFHRNVVVENNAWMWNPPDFAERVMITPGVLKYKMLQKYRKELLQSADNAIDKATQFLFLGYGFNDNHLEEYIMRKLTDQTCQGLIVTRDSNERIESLLSQSGKLWLVCKIDDETRHGTRIYNKQYADWLKIPNKNLWDISEFTTQVLGE